MKLYRELGPAEPVEVNDEVLDTSCAKDVWVRLTEKAYQIGKVPPEEEHARYRRPVTAPMLQLFSREAVLPLESRDTAAFAVIIDGQAFRLTWDKKTGKWTDELGSEVDVTVPVDAWFIDFATIPEVTT